MTNNRHLIPTAFALLIFVTVILWGLSKPNLESITGNPLYALGQLFGLIGVVLLSLNFVLSSRFGPVIRLIGFDRIFRLHRFIGITAFLLIAIHPGLFLAATFPDKTLLSSFFPGQYLPYTLGSVAFGLLTILLIATLLIKMPYQAWLRTHRLMILVLVISALHIFTVGSDASYFLPLQIWMALILLLGFVSFMYRELLYAHLGPKTRAKITRVSRRGAIVQIHAKPVDPDFSFRPGQFAFFSAPGTVLGNESHPFSFSSSPHLKSFRLAAKMVGDYTSSLTVLKKGDELLLHGPYGTFGDVALDSKQPLVFVAGGIGITPFLSLLSYLYKNDPERRINFFYSTKNLKDALYLSEIKLKTTNMKKAKLFHQKTEKNGRLTADVIHAKVKKLDQALFLLCGPRQMMQQLTSQLVKKGVPREQIFFEDFSLK